MSQKPKNTDTRYATDPEYREQVKRAARDYYHKAKADPEKHEARKKRHREWMAEARAAYSDKRKAQVAAANKRHRARRREDPAQRELDRERDRRRHWKRLYGMTVEERDALLDRQSGKCFLCHSETRFGLGAGGSAHLDHCHETGKIRGVLCRCCNTSLGKLGDTVEALERVVRYLKRELPPPPPDQKPLDRPADPE